MRAKSDLIKQKLKPLKLTLLKSTLPHCRRLPFDGVYVLHNIYLFFGIGQRNSKKNRQLATFSHAPAILHQCVYMKRRFSIAFLKQTKWHQIHYDVSSCGSSIDTRYADAIVHMKKRRTPHPHNRSPDSLWKGRRNAIRMMWHSYLLPYRTHHAPRVPMNGKDTYIEGG